MKQIFFCFYFFGIFSFTGAQEIIVKTPAMPASDFAIKKINEVEKLILKAGIAINSKSDSAKIFLEQAFTLIKNALADSNIREPEIKKKFWNLQTVALNKMGIFHARSGKFSESLECFSRALKISLGTRDTAFAEICVINMFAIKPKLPDNPAVMDLIDSGKSLYNQFGYQTAMKVTLDNFSKGLFNSNEDTLAMLECFEQGLLLSQLVGSQNGKVWWLKETPQSKKLMSDPFLAESCLSRSLNMSRKIGDLIGAEKTLLSLSLLNATIGNWEKAMNSCWESMKLNEALHNQREIIHAWECLGFVNHLVGNHSLALIYYKRGQQLRNEPGKDKDMKDEMSSGRPPFEIKGIVPEGQHKFKGMPDSKKDEVTQKALVGLQYEYRYTYEFEKKVFEDSLRHSELQKIKDAEIAVQEALVANEKTEKKALITGSVLLILLLFVSLFAYLSKRISNKRIASEKHRSDQLLLNILPAEIAEELKKFGKAKARRYEEVTVLFSDIKDFTHHTERLTPEELVAEIDYCFRNFDRIIDSHGIEKIKTVGDAYICVAGLPHADPDGAEKVVRAAIEIRNFMAKFKTERSAEGKQCFEVRMGISTGPLVAGIVGAKKFAYDIWGDTVNTAARMEQHGEVNKVNISSQTFSLVKEKFNCHHRGKVEAKNKGQVDMYFVELL